jgi:hypothetical protein
MNSFMSSTPDLSLSIAGKTFSLKATLRRFSPRRSASFATGGYASGLRTKEMMLSGGLASAAAPGVYAVNLWLELPGKTKTAAAMWYSASAGPNTMSSSRGRDIPATLHLIAELDGRGCGTSKAGMKRSR